jgi:hypothetical protein
VANPRNFSVTLLDDTYNWVNGQWVKLGTRQPSRIASFSGSDYVRSKPHGKWIQPTNYSMTAVTNIEPRGSFRYYQPLGGNKWRLQSGSNGVISNSVSNNSTLWSWMVGELDPNLSSLFPPALIDQARAKAWSSLKTSNVNLGQAWAERGQTASLVSGNLLRIVKSVRRLRRNPAVLRDIAKGANKIVKDLPTWWIEVVFGWQPLLSDIFGSINELESRHSDNTGYSVTAVGKAKRLAKYMGDVDLYGDSHDPHYAQYCTVDAEMLHGVKCRIDAAPSNDALIKASQLGLVNPLSLAWELTPWSFALDWALPLGQYFDSLDAPLGWDIKSMSTSSFSLRRMQRQGRHVTAPNGDRYEGDYSSYWRTVGLTRSTALVQPWAIRPRFKDPFTSLKRVGTALSLLHQVFGRGPLRRLH